MLYMATRDSCSRREKKAQQDTGEGKHVQHRCGRQSSKNISGGLISLQWCGGYEASRPHLPVAVVTDDWGLGRWA